MPHRLGFWRVWESRNYISFGALFFLLQGLILLIYMLAEAYFPFGNDRILFLRASTPTWSRSRTRRPTRWWCTERTPRPGSRSAARGSARCAATTFTLPRENQFRHVGSSKNSSCFIHKIWHMRQMRNLVKIRHLATPLVINAGPIGYSLTS